MRGTTKKPRNEAKKTYETCGKDVISYEVDCMTPKLFAEKGPAGYRSVDTKAAGQPRGMEFEVLCLQKNPEFIDQCIDLLNGQWPRSKTARLRSFEQGSKDGLPTSLVLIDKQSGPGKEKVLAHSKISPVPSNDTMCFVESVVVAPHLRGKGLGRLIMKQTEEYVLSKGITTVYLTTHDQQAFYEKLGYTLSEPVVVFGGRCQSLNRIVEQNMKKLEITETSKSNNSSKIKNPIAKCDPAIISKTVNIVPYSSQMSTDNPTEAVIVTRMPSSPPAPPPPPPLLIRPALINTLESKQRIEVLRTNDIKVTMKKVLF